LSRRATKSAPPFAGSAGRFAILDPALGRTWRVDVIKTETTNMCIIDHINELRAELADCLFSKDERRKLEAELAALVAECDASGCADGAADAEAFEDYWTRSPAPS
jgi:hypothetical protein